jgi:hypothetical protein
MYAVNRPLRHALLATLLLPAAALAQPQPVAGTRVTLQPPAGFVTADRFPGFMHAASGSSILITEIPAPASEMIAGLTREALAARGMEVRVSEPRTVEGQQGVLLAITQSAAGTVYDKWMLGFGDDSTVVLVTGTYPQARAAELGGPVREAVLSARRNRAAQANPLEGLGFGIDPGPRLRIASRVSNMLMINESGTVPNPGLESPLVVVGWSVAPMNARDVETFSRQRVMQAEAGTRVSNVTGSPVTIDGAASYELFADAVDTESSTQLRIYQIVIPETNSYLLFQGIVGADRAADWLPYFQTVARSLRRTR